MKSYGQFCPVAKAAEIFCERWTALIIRDLAAGAERFADLQRGVPLMSPTLLSRRLKQLEAEDILERRRAAGGRGFTYHLTRAGREFVPLVEGLGAWGQRWSRRGLTKGEIDLGLLIWAMERSVKGAALGPGRRVVEVEFTDQPARRRCWWFLHDGGATQLCLENPGFEVDAYLSSSLPDMIRIVRGDLSIASALEQERLGVVGPGRTRRWLSAWLNLSPISAIRSQQATSQRSEGGSDHARPPAQHPALEPPSREPSGLAGRGRRLIRPGGRPGQNLVESHGRDAARDGSRSAR
jgi:DNA-binding HxlR family transcriptional regulator